VFLKTKCLEADQYSKKVIGKKIAKSIELNSIQHLLFSEAGTPLGVFETAFD
jgi:hypothetical protein